MAVCEKLRRASRLVFDGLGISGGPNFTCDVVNQRHEGLVVHVVWVRLADREFAD